MSLRTSRATILALLTLFWSVSTAQAETWNLTTGGTWNSAASWNPASIPNSAGATAIFTGTNSVNRTITNDSGAAGFTVGNLSFDTTGAGTFTNSLTTGATGSKLTFDNTGFGDAVITTQGTGTGNNTISVPLVFTSNVIANVNQTTATSAAGSLNLTATITGVGGFTKNGDGLATFGTGAKTYSGPTVLNGGRMRMSVAASPTATSSFTINAGGQLDLVVAGTYTFGAGSLNLNGSGATTGAFAAFPGAIRNDTGLVITITNAVVLQTNTLIHVQATPVTLAGSLTFSNSVSGSGSLSVTAPTSNSDIGTLILNVANTYTGGTLVRGGTLLLNSGTATLGSGSVTVDNTTSPSSTALLSIPNSGANVISDTTFLAIGGGKVSLGTGVNETVGMLFLNSIMQPPGTYGSTSSVADFRNDTYFSGTGMITVVSEPTLFLGLVGGIFAISRIRRSVRA